MEFINRIGVFFLWIGTISVLLFLFSSIAEATIFNLLIVGIVFIFFGIVLWKKNKPQSPKSDRFRIFKPSKSKKKDSSKSAEKDIEKPRNV